MVGVRAVTLRRLQWLVAMVAVVLAIWTAKQRHVQDARDHATDFVEYAPGTTAVVVLVAHDGHQWRASVPPRSVEPRRDHGTRALAEELVDAVQRTTGARPHLIALGMDRRQLDVNRRRDQAYEHPLAGEVYDAFHARVAEVTGRLSRAGPVLVLDLHGNWEFPADLYLDTDAGVDATIDGALRAAARRAGFSTADPDQTPPRLRGGHIVGQIVGQFPGRDVDAVTVEVHARVRMDPHARRRMADALAAAVAQSPYVANRNEGR